MFSLSLSSLFGRVAAAASPIHTAVPPILSRSTNNLPIMSLLINTPARYLHNIREPEPNSGAFFPLPETVERSYIKSFEEYKALYKDSIENAEIFWGDLAREELLWKTPFDSTFLGSFKNSDFRWFTNGTLNVSVNCIDRHVVKNPNQLAIIWEGDEIGENRSITYEQLLIEVSKIANALKRAGVRKGDAVIIYMPMVPEAAFAMLACARIGAIHSVVFAGFSSNSLRDRIVDSHARFIFTSNEGVRGGRKVPLLATVNDAVKDLKIDRIFIHRRTDKDPIGLVEGRDVWLHEATAIERPYCPPEWLDSEDPLFYLYTSGSTGKPKGVIHTQAGYLLHAAISHKLVFDYRPGDVYACVADVGWITGHSYIVYGPLCNGGTTLMFESLPNYPTPSRYWQLIEKHKVNVFYTAPTAVRSLMKFGEEPILGHDLSSLKVIGSVGEPINPEAWKWLNDFVGKGKTPIVDTYWQTETGGHVLTPLPGSIPAKPGAACVPFLGIDPIILDSTSGKPVEKKADGSSSGVLCIGKPWPGMARSIAGDHPRFVETYFTPYPGYYFTGDGVNVDSDGYIWVTGRVDDVINKSGHRLGTAEIESALVSHAACAEAAVVAIPDDVRGQAIVAFCSLKAGIEETKEVETMLRNQVRSQIGPIATPDHIILSHNLPKTRSGKIMRRLLRKIAEGNTSDLGDTSTLADESVVADLVNKVKSWAAGVPN